MRPTRHNIERRNDSEKTNDFNDMSSSTILHGCESQTESSKSDRFERVDRDDSDGFWRRIVLDSATNPTGRNVRCGNVDKFSPKRSGRYRSLQIA